METITARITPAQTKTLLVAAAVAQLTEITAQTVLRNPEATETETAAMEQTPCNEEPAQNTDKAETAGTAAAAVLPVKRTTRRGKTTPPRSLYLKEPEPEALVLLVKTAALVA